MRGYEEEFEVSTGRERTLARQAAALAVSAEQLQIRALILVNEFLEYELQTKVSQGYANALFSCSTNAAAATGSTRLRRVASSNRACSKGGSIKGRATMSPGGISALPGLRNWKQTPRFI